MVNSGQNQTPRGRWQDESLARDEGEDEGVEVVDNPEHMVSPDSMANPQSTKDVGRKSGEDGTKEPERRQNDLPNDSSERAD